MTLHVERPFHQTYEVIGSHRLCQRTYYAATTLRVPYPLRTQELDVRQAQLLGYLEVHATPGIVHVRMHRHHADILPDSLAHRPLHVGQVADSLQPTKQQRVVAHNEITTLLYRLVDDFFRHIQTQ